MHMWAQRDARGLENGDSNLVRNHELIVEKVRKLRFSAEDVIFFFSSTIRHPNTHFFLVMLLVNHSHSYRYIYTIELRIHLEVGQSWQHELHVYPGTTSSLIAPTMWARATCWTMRALLRRSRSCAPVCSPLMASCRFLITSIPHSLSLTFLIYIRLATFCLITRTSAAR